MQGTADGELPRTDVQVGPVPGLPGVDSIVQTG